MPRYVIPASAECLAACGCSTVCCVTAKFRLWLAARQGSLGGIDYLTWEIFYGGDLVERSQRQIITIDDNWDLRPTEGGLDLVGSDLLTPTFWGMMPAGTDVDVDVTLTNMLWRQLASRLCGGDGSMTYTFLSSGSHTISETVQSADAPSDPTGFPWDDGSFPPVTRYAVTSEQTITLCR